MPELPEVETTCRGIKKHLVQRKVTQVIIRQTKLRWLTPIDDLQRYFKGQVILGVKRRAKYILIQVSTGHLIIHLGMSGSLRILPVGSPVGKHDHFDCTLNSGTLLRYHDPRRFGAILWQKNNETIPFLAKLGPEPLTAAFSGDYLFQRATTLRCSVKSFIMDQKIVVGVGNIYANESLFAAKIHPLQAANQISLAKYRKLHTHIQSILKAAIKQGGTTLKDFTQSDGKPGYFGQKLKVYGRKDQACYVCQGQIQSLKVAQRTTYFCSKCQD